MPPKKIRVLHVVGGMNRGGVETWLMHVLRHIDRKRFSFDFLVHTTDPCVFDSEILDLGGKIIFCKNPSRPWQYARNFKKILRKYGPYDVVHSHVYHYTGFVLRLANSAKVPVRIAHCHTDAALKDGMAGIFRATYLKLMKLWILRFATVGIACSRQAATSLFGKDWKKDSRWQVHPYGIDLLPFHQAVSDNKMRSSLGIKAGALVVGHVGSFSEPKNHRFLIEIYRAMLNFEPKAILLLVGKGPLRKNIQELITRYGLEKKIIFAKPEVDVPRVMIEAMDVFVFPSLWEGLPLSLIEAQAAGLPIVISETITNEIDLADQQVFRLSLKRSPEAWAEQVIKAVRTRPLSKAGLSSVIEQCRFNIKKSIFSLVRLYEA